MVQTDNSPAENIKPVKATGKSRARRMDENRIDGVVSLVMALGLAMAEPEDTDYDDLYGPDSDLGIDV